MRPFVPLIAVGLPIVLGLALLYLYVDGRIGVATVTVACFALGAVVATALLMHRDDDQEADPGPWLHF